MCHKWLLLLAFPLASVSAGDATLDRATLKGLAAVSVVIDRIDPALSDLGLSAASLQTRLEDRLLHNDIKVDDKAIEFLGLRITGVRGKRGPWAVCLNLGVYQPVNLVRDKNLRTSTETWEVETVLMADPKVLDDAATDSLNELADRFITAYRSVNPKPVAAP